MLERFGDYLKRKRKAQGYTQEMIATAFSSFSPVLTGIDAVTISRWERFTTEPPISRQKEIICFFKDEISEVFPFMPAKTTLQSTDQSVAYLLKHYLNSTKLQSKIGTYPEQCITNYELRSLLSLTTDEHLLRLILDYDHSIYQSDNNVTLSTLQKWMQSGCSPLMLACTKLGHYFGHLIALPVTLQAFLQLINNELAEADICLSHLASVNEPHCLYVFSLYGGSRLAASLIILQVMSYVSQYRDYVQKIGGLCATSDGVRLAKAFHLQPKFVGPTVANGSVRFQGREVEFVTFSANVTDILADRGVRQVMTAFAT
ncbi:helix-turn-helix domain-containing protein [Zooshikella sp. RANM57]|uniref:helix-turn-helix domain-containing protein n=1 Tax=Zooshikella sp. RANM57 TaxID=3425863 RepID=UPI003D6FC41C